MIVHFISPYTPPPQPVGKASEEFLRKFTGGNFGDEKHRRFIHQRALKLCKFSEGERVKYRNKAAKIEAICDNFEEVAFDGLTCLYIMISLRGGDEYELVHHSMLKKVSK